MKACTCACWQLDGGLDPDEYVKQNGAGRVSRAARFGAAATSTGWPTARARRFDMRSADGRMDAFKFLLPAVQKISDKLERAAVASDLAGYLGVDRDLVLDQFKRAATERRSARPDTSRSPAAGRDPGTREDPAECVAVERTRPARRFCPALLRELTAGFVTHEFSRRLRQVAAAGALAFSALDGRLSEPGRDLLHEIAVCR